MLVTEVNRPSSLPALLELLARRPATCLYAGGTDLLRGQAGRALELPAEIAMIGRLPELRQVSLTERFVDLGAALSLAELLELRENALPELLAQALRGVGSPALRNLATLGGNLSSRSRFMDLWPALACLDALAEYRSHSGSRWLNVNRLADEEGRPAPPEGQVLCRVRVPLERWDLCLFKKVGPADYPARASAAFALALRADKGVLSEFRLAFAGEVALRLRDVESRVVGRRLPLPARERSAFARDYQEAARILPPGLARAFASLVEGALELLAR